MVARMKRDAFEAYDRARDRFMHGRSLESMPPVPAIIAREVAEAEAALKEQMTANG